MSYIPPNPNGQATKANSSPVVIASDQNAVPVTGTFYQTTQPISGSVSVTGSFWQSTQPVSIASMPSTPVTGTFYQTTQPISGSVTVSNFPASQAVTGSFYQATQPVSIASMPSTPVTGTFYPTTQPVSLATAPTTPVTGTFWQTTQPVSGSFYQATQPISGTVTVTQGTLTKGTQGAVGVSTQDLKDAGRTYICITIDTVTGITTEALATMSINKAGTTTTGTSYAVTTGKTLRITSFCSSVKNTSTVVSTSRIRVRAAATVAATSSILIANETYAPGAVANMGGVDDTTVPDGIEIAAGIQIGISHIEAAITCTASCCLMGYEY